MSTKRYKHDGKTTYCYYITSKITEALPGSADAKSVVKASGSECPVQLKVEIADTVKLNNPIPLRFTAVVDDRNTPADFEFHKGVIPASPVPPKLISQSNNGTDGSAATKGFQVPVANVVMCDYGKCDMFTNPDAPTGNYYKSLNNPNNFDNNVAVFGSTEIVIPKGGKYTGFAHITIPIGVLSRADFVVFFPVQVGPAPGAVSSGIKSDSQTTYCWTAKGASPFDTRVSESDIVLRSGDSCPGTMKAKLARTSVLINEDVPIEWSLQIDGAARDPATLIAEVSPDDAIKDPATGIWSVVPVSVLSTCQDVAGKKCSTYSGDGSTTVDVVKFNNQNLTGGATTYSTSHKFTEPGNYLVVSRVAMQTTDGDRIDMAVYSKLEVTIPSSKSSKAFLFIGLGIGALILILGFGFCYMRKKRARQMRKEIPFRTPMPPPSAGPDRSSQYTATSSNFLTHRSPQMKPYPPAFPSGETSFYPAGGDGMHGQPPQQHHKESFSLDPYNRSSFNEMGEDESIDMTIRPSEAGKFSFAPGYDDESEWEYDTRSLRSDNRYAEGGVGGTRGTFQLQGHSVTGSMPIMEEDDHHHHNHQHQYRPTAPRSTTSSTWTAN